MAQLTLAAYGLVFKVTCFRSWLYTFSKDTQFDNCQDIRNSCLVMSSLGEVNFSTNGHAQLHNLTHVIQHEMSTVYHSPIIYFVLLPFLLLFCVNFRRYLRCSSVQFLWGFPFLMWSLLQMLFPVTRPFIFRVLVCPCHSLLYGQVQYVMFL